MSGEGAGDEVHEALASINNQSLELLSELDAIKARSAKVLEDIKAIEGNIFSDGSIIRHAELMDNLVAAIKETEIQFIEHLGSIIESEKQ